VLSLIPGVGEVLADKAYDTNASRACPKQYAIKPVIPGKSNRKKRIRQSHRQTASTGGAHVNTAA
jgi:hypothetical protein